MRKGRASLQSYKARDSKEESAYFARGQFLELSDSEKLNAPAFEKMESGIRSDGLVELTVALPEKLFRQVVQESRRQNIKTEVLVRIVLERVFLGLKESRRALSR